MRVGHILFNRTSRGAAALAILTLAAGCGGGDDASTTQTQGAPTKTGSGSGTPAKTTTAVRVTRHDKKVVRQEYRDAAAVAPGDIVQVQSVVTNAAEAKGSIVELRIPQSSVGRELKVASGPDSGAKTTARFVTPDGKPFVLENLRYGCATPPDTFCPIQSIKKVGRSYNIRVPAPAKAGVPIIFVAEVAAAP